MFFSKFTLGEKKNFLNFRAKNKQCQFHYLTLNQTFLGNFQTVKTENTVTKSPNFYPIEKKVNFEKKSTVKKIGKKKKSS